MGLLGLDAVRAIHQPPERFRISPYRYEAGVTSPGAARAGHRYVLAGACAFTFGTETWELRAGDIAELPAGGYQFHVLGAQPVEFVAVWELPPEVWSQGSATEWSRTPTAYEARRDHLLGGLKGGLNGTTVLGPATVADDGAADALTGGDGRDWLFDSAVTPDVLTDPAADETVTRL